MPKTSFKTKTKTRAEAISELVAEGRLDKFDGEDLLYLEPKWRTGQYRHPMYQQWRKMVDGCIDPRSIYWDAFGAKGVAVYAKWMNFDTFIADMGPTWDDDESKPENFRRIYIGRTNLKAGFNPKNAVWMTQPQAMQVQSKTRFVETPFGKTMTLRELEKYLLDHAGEDLPEGCGPYRIWMRQYDFDAGRFSAAKPVEITTISPVKLTELRRRHSKGFSPAEMIRPTRPYGETSDRLESEHLARLETERKRREDAASALGLTLAEYNLLYDLDNKPTKWATGEHPMLKKSGV